MNGRAQGPWVDFGEGVRWNPYLAGALAGLLAVVSLALTGKYFGASTTFVVSVNMIESAAVPEHAQGLAYFAKYAPAPDWQMLFVAGIFAGALLSALTSGSFALEKAPTMWVDRFGPSLAKRGAVAFVGGVAAIMGARMAGGCPSGHGLSGLSQLAVSGFVALPCFFLGGLLMARILYGRRS